MSNRATALQHCASILIAALLPLLAPAAANASADNYVPEYKWNAPPWELNGVEGYGRIDSGDFDGDGRTDIVAQIGAGYTTRVLFFFQRADGLEPVPVEYVLTPFSPFHYRSGTAVADLDNDGRPELLFSTNKGLVVLWMAVDRSIRTTSHIEGDRMAYSPPLAVDVDEDGHLDVVQSEGSKFGTQPNELVIRYGDGSGNFPRTRLIPTGEFRYVRLESGDMNGDGHVDLVSRLSASITTGPAPVGILYSDGRGSFKGPDLRLSRFTYDDVLVGDMNNDGRDDMLLVNPSQDNEFTVSQAIRPGEIFHQRADGTLPGQPRRISLVGRSTGFNLADLDGDGELDLVTISDVQNGSLGVHLQRDGVMPHAREFTLPFTFSNLGAPPDFHRQSQVYGDFNGDGITDVVYTGGYSPLVMMAGRLQPFAAGRPPGPPRLVTASGSFETTVIYVSFQPPLDGGTSPITHYLVEPEPEGGVRDGAFQGDPLLLTHGMIGQINGQRYRYRVRAFNASGPGPLSEPSPEIQVRKLPFMTAKSDWQFEPSSGTGKYRVEFMLSSPALDGGVSFDVVTRDVTAKAGLDYQAVDLKGVHIPAGSLSVFVDVPTYADNLPEVQESFDMLVSNVSEARHGGQRAHCTIMDPMPALTVPTLQVLPPTVSEGNTGVTVMRFPILMPVVSATDVSFNVRTFDITAKAGEDYVAQSTRLVIPAGQTSSHFDVPVLTDIVDEEDESLMLFVDGLVGANVSSPSTTGTIRDDDRALDGIPEVLEVTSEKGYVDREFMLLSAADARLSGTAMVTPAYRNDMLVADPTPALPFDGLATGVSWSAVVIPANPTPAAVDVRLLALAESATAARVALFVGAGDVPSAGSTACAQDGTGPSQVCELVVRQEPGAPERRYWVLAQNAQAGGSGLDSVELEAGAVAIVPVNRELVVSAQGTIFGAAFPARLGWDIPSLLPGERRLGYVLVEAAPGVLIYQEPLRMHRTGTLDAPHVLAPGVDRAVHLAAGDAQERLVFDVPVNAASVTFTLRGTGEASLYASHDPQPSSPVIVPAPPRAQADALSSLPGAVQSITLSGAQLKTGRWYLTPMNRGDAPAALTVRADVVRQGARPSFRPGHYFNPARPGHGLFLDFAGNQWVMVWYTYLQDGTPTWYYTQGPTPADDDSQWPVDLLRVSRGRDETRAVRVGSATLSILEGAAGASPKIAFAYNLDGDAGWETLTRLGDDTCPMYGGQKLDATGHWFAPADPGYGFSAQILPNTEIYAAYIYDSPGFPRWLIGQKDYDPTGNKVTMQQLSGFCPTCPLVPLQSKSVATLTRTLGASSSNDGRAGITSLEMYALFEKPVTAGPFAGSAPVYLLSARKGCD